MGNARTGYECHMQADIREWTAPAPLRALLWWPATAFVLVVVAPGAATESIALAGAVLAMLGGMIPAIARRLRRILDPETAFAAEEPDVELALVPSARQAA